MDGMMNGRADGTALALRDRFACAAMAQIIRSMGLRAAAALADVKHEEAVASLAYRYADAMLAEREKGAQE